MAEIAGIKLANLVALLKTQRQAVIDEAAQHKAALSAHMKQLVDDDAIDQQTHTAKLNQIGQLIALIEKNPQFVDVIDLSQKLDIDLATVTADPPVKVLP